MKLKAMKNTKKIRVEKKTKPATQIKMKVETGEVNSVKILNELIYGINQIRSQIPSLAMSGGREVTMDLKITSEQKLMHRYVCIDCLRRIEQRTRGTLHDRAWKMTSHA